MIHKNSGELAHSIYDRERERETMWLEVRVENWAKYSLMRSPIETIIIVLISGGQSMCMHINICQS